MNKKKSISIITRAARLYYDNLEDQEVRKRYLEDEAPHCKND